MNAILLVAEREDSIHQSVNRALMLARYLHVRLDILLCDSALAYGPGPERAPPQATESAHRYLEALRQSVTAPDVQIATHAAFDGPLHEQVAQTVRSECCTLVIKGVGGHQRASEGRVDWQLSRSCPVPLLLTQGRPWHPQARFAAAIDLMDSHRPQLSHVISRTIVSLRGACGADLDLLYAQPDGLPDAPAMARSLLQALLPEVAPAAARVHLLEGDAKQVLPGFAQERDYDLIAVGMLREASFACYLRSLLAQLLRSLRGDVLIVKPEG